MFSHSINNWDDWGNIFTSPQAFTTIIKQSFEDSNVPISHETVQTMQAGTNAVFRIGNYVIKISPPKECGKDFSLFRSAEISMLAHCKEIGINCPALLAEGFIEDKYRFNYILIEYIDGNPISKVLTGIEPKALVNWLKTTLLKLNKPICSSSLHSIPGLNDSPQSFFTQGENRKVNPCLKSELEIVAHKRFNRPYVLVHGDITADNVIYKNGEFYLIDFGDCMTAPKEYELAPVILDLFKGNSKYVAEYISNSNPINFIEDLIFSLSIHEYGVALLSEFLQDRAVTLENIENVSQLKQILRTLLLKP